MILERVTLKDFLSHRSTEVSFSSGVTAFVGPNGAGKSAVLDAISFALFKEHSRGRGLEALIRRGSQSAEVSLQFRVGHRRYVVRRRLVRVGRGARCEAFLYECDGGRLRLLARGDRAVSAEVARIVGIDRATFINAVYVRQGEMDRLVTAQAHERKQVISKLLGLDDLERAWRLMREVTVEFERRRAQLEASVSERERLVSELGRLKGEVMEVRRELEASEARLRELEALLKSRRAELERAEEARRQHERLVAALEAVEGDARTLESLLSSRLRELREAELAGQRLRELEPKVRLLPKLEGLRDAARELEHLRAKRAELAEDLRRALEAEATLRELGGCEERLARLRALAERFAALKAAASDAERAVRELQKRLELRREALRRLLREASAKLGADVSSAEELTAAVEAKLREIETERERLASEVDRLNREAGMLAQAMAEAESKLGELEGAGGECPLCGAPLSEAKRRHLLERYGAELAELRERARELEARRRCLSERLGALSRAAEELRGVDVASALALQKQVSDLEGMLSSERERLERLAGEMRRVSADIASLGVEDVEAGIRELEDACRRYAVAAELVKRRSPGALKRELAELDSKISALEAKLAPLRERFGEALAEAIERELGELRALKSEYDRLSGVAAREPALRAEVEQLKAKLESRRREAERLRREISRLAFDEEAYASIKREVEELEAERSSIALRASRLRERLGILLKLIRDAETRLREVEEAERELGRLARFINALERVRRLYGKDGLQKRIRALARPLIERYTRSFFAMFGLGYHDLIIDDDYNVTLVGAGGEQSVDSISGGERAALALAMRLALARVLVGGALEFVMLDEPTVNMDESRRRELVRVLKRVAGGGATIPQLIVVTHDREVEEAADAVYLVSKESGVSRVELQQELGG